MLLTTRTEACSKGEATMHYSMQKHCACKSGKVQTQTEDPAQCFRLQFSFSVAGAFQHPLVLAPAIANRVMRRTEPIFLSFLICLPARVAGCEQLARPGRKNGAVCTQVGTFSRLASA